jgi:hypothetical protein
MLLASFRSGKSTDDKLLSREVELQAAIFVGGCLASKILINGVRLTGDVVVGFGFGLCLFALPD